MKDFDFNSIESKWKDKWYDSDLYQAKDFDSKPKKYVLVEFPYPSGSGLHVGHAFSFIGGDVFARFHRHRGYNVLFPMGWDAFGLPAENYAIKMKKMPQITVAENAIGFKEEMKSLGLSFDWSREVNTTDADYYKWTQWIFIKLFERGLAYKEERPINWCPSCKIGLADEEVVAGNCERCGSVTDRRNINQWIVKITDYSDRLIEGLKNTAFEEKVKAAQINWIDKKEWIDITYNIEGTDEQVTVATTRPDTNFGATFIVLAPEHKLVGKVISGKLATSEDVANISDYVKKALNKSELDRQKDVLGRNKSGVFTGLYAINNLNGAKMPIWITDFVLGTVGTGAVVGVPAHDIRDFEFAKQFGLPIIRVVVGKDGDSGEIIEKEQVQEEEGTMINSGFLDGMEIMAAKSKIMEYLEEKGWGKKTVRYHLRDWIFSRQHYWGEPIPMVNCEKCGWNPVNETDLPIKLPDLKNYEPTDNGESPLSKVTDWVNTTCPKCGGEAKRETDTMPNWAGSDWYFLRYLDKYNTNEIASADKQKYWMPVDTYLGGDEHNTLHLLYSRFIYQVLSDIGVTATEEPYYQRISHGVILGPDNKRMSKSKGNVIIPSDVRAKVGSDATRAYLMFIGPFASTMPWNDNALNGVKRFIQRVYKFIESNTDKFTNDENQSHDIAVALNEVVKYSTHAIETFSYNTVVAKYMELLNLFEKTGAESISKETIKKFIILLAPFTPFLSEELWNVMGETYSVHSQLWPEVKDIKSETNSMVIPVQVNGKVRGRVQIDISLEEGEVKKLVLEDKTISVHLLDKEIVKFVYIKNKIVNIVLK
jgi:leucyl-tRNA synthetase